MRSGRARPTAAWVAAGAAAPAAVLLGAVVWSMKAPPHHWPFLAILALFALSQLVVVQLDFGLTYSWVEVPLLIALVALEPRLLVGAWLLSGAITLGVVRRQPPTQLFYNLSWFGLESVVAVLVFRACSDAHRLLSGGTLAGALLAAAAVSLLSSLSLAWAGDETAHDETPDQMEVRARNRVTSQVAPNLIASVLTAGTVLLGVVVQQTDPAALWLLAAPVGAAWLGGWAFTRHARRWPSAPPTTADPLTGLPTAARFMSELDRTLRNEEVTACFFVRLGGAGAGSEQLAIVAGQRVAGCLRSGDLAARLESNLVTVLAHVDAEEAKQEAGVLGKRIRLALARPARIGDDSVDLAARIGVVLARKGDSADGVLTAGSRLVDRAGRGRVVIFEEGRRARTGAAS